MLEWDRAGKGQDWQRTRLAKDKAGKGQSWKRTAAGKGQRLEEDNGWKRTSWRRTSWKRTSWHKTSWKRAQGAEKGQRKCGNKEK